MSESLVRQFVVPVASSKKVLESLYVASFKKVPETNTDSWEYKGDKIDILLVDILFRLLIYYAIPF